LGALLYSRALQLRPGPNPHPPPVPLYNLRAPRTGPPSYPCDPCVLGYPGQVSCPLEAILEPLVALHSGFIGGRYARVGPASNRTRVFVHPRAFPGRRALERSAGRQACYYKWEVAAGAPAGGERPPCTGTYPLLLRVVHPVDLGPGVEDGL
jgi:hypothetical protein